MKSDTFCILPFSHLATSADGTLRACCHYRDQIRKGDIPFQMGRDSLYDAFSSAAMERLRADMLAGRKVKACSECYTHESSGIESKRMKENNGLSPEKIEELIRSPRVVSADLRPGNLCNLKCVSCNPISSSQLHSEMKAYGPENFSPYVNLTLEQANKIGSWYEQERFLEDLNRLLAESDNLLFLGGEPFLQKGCFELLERFTFRGKNFKLQFVSNLTKIEPHHIEVLKHFNTHIVASIDGVGEVLEYIRYPAKFKRIDSTFEALLANQISVTISPAISVLNLFSLDRFFLWKWKKESRYKLFIHSPVDNVLLFPDYLSIHHLPRELKQLAIERLRSVREICRPPHHQDHQEIRKLIGVLSQENGSPEIIRNGWRYQENFDAIRKNSWREVVPELTDFLN